MPLIRLHAISHIYLDLPESARDYGTQYTPGFDLKSSAAMASRNLRHFTQWAAQFAVASELCKRNYEVAFTMGNATPLADLMVVSPGKWSFLIDVKGQRRSSFWQVKEREEIRDDLFYVLAFVPPNKPNRYFVLSHGDVHGLIEDYKTSGVKYDPRFPGFNWTDCHGFEDQWGRLPE